MKDIVIHVREDICAKHKRDPEATKLIEVAKEFGSVESLESAIAKERSEHQEVVKNLKVEYEKTIAGLEERIAKILEQEVTPEEIKVLKVLREKSSVEATQYLTAIAARDEQLKIIAAENENRVAQLKSLFKL